MLIVNQKSLLLGFLNAKKFSAYLKFYTWKIMELFFAIGLPMILLIGLTFFFMSEGIPAWIENLSGNSSTIWNFGIVSMSTMTIIIYLSRR